MHFNFKIIAVEEDEKSLEACKGENGKGVLLIYRHHPDLPHCDKLLSDILKAVHIQKEADTLYVEAQEDLHYSMSTILSKNTLERVIVFGLSPEQLGLNMDITLYHPFKLSGCTLLFAHSLEEIAANRPFKIALWKNMQTLFLNKPTP